MIWTIILAAMLVTTAESGIQIAQRSPRVEDYRLPTTTIPESYQITLNTNLDPSFSYDGETVIKIIAKAVTNDIVMHTTTGVIIDENTLTVNGAKPAGVTYDIEKDIITIRVSDALVVDQIYEIYMKFTGNIREDTSGFYRSSYINKNKEKVWLATTQFQPTHARLVFPCYDEPGLKATFTFIITHDPKYNAISNMPVEDLRIVNGRSVTTFKESPKMSTYLLAFVISDYVSIQDFDDSFKVYTYENSIESAKYALDFGQKALKFLEKFTKHQYQLPKLDMVSIADFTMGAMENWGLVTYREPYLLYTEGVSTSRNKQNIANMIAHELSHMWFGNQVTPEWWDCSWLNEGFATLLEYYTTAHIEKNWRMMDQYLVNVVQNVMESDSVDTTRPMTSPMQTPTQIADSFNYVIYSKAGAVLRMMQHVLTASAFEEGLTLYLNERKYTTTNPDHLYSALQKKEIDILPKSVTVKEIMDSWTTQKGFPVITVTRNYTNGVTQFQQERFLLHSKTDVDAVKYWVPINYGHISDDFEDTSVTDWIPPTIKSIVITFNYPKNWIIVNKQQTGYYRVNYDETNWNLLSNTLNSDDFYKIHILNRAQLVDDALNLARAGRLEYNTAFDILNYLERETDYIPWSAVMNELTFLNRMLAASPEYHHFRRYIWDIISNVYYSFHFEEHESDAHVVKLNRIIIQNWACGMSMDICIEDAMESLNSWRYAEDVSENPIAPNQRPTIYCNGVRYSNGGEWDFLWEQFENTDVSADKDIIIANLGCVQKDELIDKYLQLSISGDEHLRAGDPNGIFISIYSSGIKGVNKSLEFLEDNFSEMKTKYSRFGEAISGLGNFLVTQEHRNKLQSIITTHEKDFTEIQALNAQLALTNVDTNLQWLSQYGAEISKWLLENIPEPAPERGGATTILINFTLLFASIVFCFLVYH